jgi:hypothetical protein
LAALAFAHPWLEQTMARHMGLELPALFILGWLAAAHADRRPSGALADWNVNGVPGLLFALCVTGFWMVPAALDRAVLDDSLAIAKIASLVAAGLLARASWPAAGMVVQGFFVLNWFWMTLAAGLLYQEAPQQLCSVYLINEQAQAGTAIMVWALAGLGAWLGCVSLETLRQRQMDRPP